MFSTAVISTPEDILRIVKECNCRSFYVYYNKFIYGNFSQIEEYIYAAHAQNCKIFVNFKHDILEEDIDKIKKFVLFLTYTKIDGILVNSLTVLEAIKNLNLNFEIIADSYLGIHNIEGIKFLNKIRKIDKFVITEDAYLKNLETIKEKTNISIAIDSDNLPWLKDKIKNSNLIDTVIIKGDFSSGEEILAGIKAAEDILLSEKDDKKKSLPFNHLRNCQLKTNHFSEEIHIAKGKSFYFKDNIQPYQWNEPQKVDTKISKDFNIPRINLRIKSLSQIEEIKKLINNLSFNPISSIEYGEIIDTKDLCQNSVTEVMKKVSTFCKELNIELNYSTPRILIERDFNRVYQDAKEICKANEPISIVINNLGFFNRFINDKDMKDIPIEIGTGINLLNSLSIMCLDDFRKIDGLDFSMFQDYFNIQKCIRRLGKRINRRKLTILGNIRIPSDGLCPLNSEFAEKSRIDCHAVCQKEMFAIQNPQTSEKYPFVTDGFCRIHLYKDKIQNLCEYIKLFEETGINEFVIDMNCLPASYLQTLIYEFLKSDRNTLPTKLPLLTEYLI